MAYDFNGTNNWFTTTSSPLSGIPLTMSCWFNSDSISSSQTLVNLVNASGGNRYLGLFLSGDIAGDPVQFWIYDGSLSQGVRTSSGYSSGTWNHACGVAENATSRIVYLNGANSGTATNSINLSPPNQIRIGRFVNANNVPSSYMDGRIAEIGIWNAALTAAEIASLAKGMTCEKVRPQSLVFYAPLVRDLLDQKGGLTITNNNAATVANHPRVYA